MIGYGQPEAGLAKEVSCRIDPEEMLQRCRKNLEATLKAKNLLFELSELPVSVHFGDRSEAAFSSAIGNLELRIYSLNKEIESWLREMDKD